MQSYKVRLHDQPVSLHSLPSAKNSPAKRQTLNSLSKSAMIALGLGLAPSKTTLFRCFRIVQNTSAAPVATSVRSLPEATLLHQLAITEETVGIHLSLLHLVRMHV